MGLLDFSTQPAGEGIGPLLRAKGCSYFWMQELTAHRENVLTLPNFSSVFSAWAFGSLQEANSWLSNPDKAVCLFLESSAFHSQKNTFLKTYFQLVSYL